MCDYLITGVAGFVGTFLIKHLRTTYCDVSIIGTDVSVPPSGQALSDLTSFESLNLLDLEKLRAIVKAIKPKYLIHLASYSSVSFSWEQPSVSFLNNTNIYLNVLEIVRAVSPETRVLSIGSSEEYGAVHAEDVPLNEERVLVPTSPYGVARVSQEQLSRVYSTGYGLDIVLTRSFNHIGPGQRDTFVVSSFAKQFASALVEGRKEFSLVVGNIDIIRDFTDVRDVVRAYDILLKKAAKDELYNVCSGRGFSLREIILRLEGLTGVKANVKIDPTRVRPSENPIIIGDNRKIREKCGWIPERQLDATLMDILKYWEKALLAESRLGN